METAGQMIIAMTLKTNDMAEINNDSTAKKRSGHKTTNRRSTRVDLTPMVDLGFLLITFFVFTTSMTEPKAMDIIEPNKGDERPVKESGAMTIILGEEHKVYYYYGQLDTINALTSLKTTDMKGIRDLITKKKKTTAIGDLMYVIKGDKRSTFKDMIDILDEMAICDIPPGHYAEVDITKEELKLVGKE